MAFEFPKDPEVNKVVTIGDTSYRWDGVKWFIIQTPPTDITIQAKKPLVRIMPGEFRPMPMGIGINTEGEDETFILGFNMEGIQPNSPVFTYDVRPVVNDDGTRDYIFDLTETNVTNFATDVRSPSGELHVYKGCRYIFYMEYGTDEDDMIKITTSQGDVVFGFEEGFIPNDTTHAVWHVRLDADKYWTEDDGIDTQALRYTNGSDITGIVRVHTDYPYGYK